MLRGLRNKGLEGFLKAVLEDEEAKVKARQHARQPGQERTIVEDDEKINRANEGMELRKLDEELRSVQEDEERKRMGKDVVMTGAKMIRKEIDQGLDTITSVYIMADGKELVQGGLMIFKVTVGYKGEKTTLEEKWAPMQKPAALYRDIMTKLLPLGKISVKMKHLNPLI
ncbi:hypothetical protein FBEOM_7689 [Fusarium beomiforme]|uniref:Uncharacterized protein n=1 Tax=Fusarium beomiforme TaxID=44412 RepID=A0A9P5AGL9_9HYPO|nr:hypothetical protein FBEOM_7689 [Fusarium beomiforme]